MAAGPLELECTWGRAEAEDGWKEEEEEGSGCEDRVGRGGAFTALNSPCKSVILQICIQMNEEFFKELGRVVQEWGQLGGGGVSLPVGV